MRLRALVLVGALVGANGCDYAARPAVESIDAADDASNLDGSASDAIDLDGSHDDAFEAIDAPVDAPMCSEGARRCEGNSLTECQADTWQPLTNCTNLCAAGSCVTPPSCAGGLNQCGVGGTETCCASLPIPGGTFSRSYDGVSPGFVDNRYLASVSAFDLDRFEVTRGRFQKFIDAYPGSRPLDGSGRNPSDSDDPGWLPSWTSFLPATSADLTASLSCDGITAQTASDPVRCVSWYVAQAFCIWDGGRLPTEAEWNLAAAGGAEQRVYPWSVPASSTVISSSHANYQSAAPSRPGVAAQGTARWGHADLAGNVWEWVFDNYVTPYPTTSCDDCANHVAAASRAVRGGSFLNTPSILLASYRSGATPTTTNRSTGLRCARNPEP